MPGETLADLLTRVRKSLAGDAKSDATAPQVDETLIRRVQADSDVPSWFANRAEAVGMKVQRTTQAKLAAELGELLKQLGVKRVTTSFADSSEIDPILAANGIERVDWRAADGLENHYDVDAGISDVASAVGETGTLVYRSGPNHSRGQCLVPPVHIALVREEQIVPDLLDATRALGADASSGLPAGILLITGPSKTADIEGQLVTGVHGPRDVYVLLISNNE